MDKVLLDKYKKRISSSTPLQLTNISFELFTLYATEALECDRTSDDFIKNVKKAQDFIVTLRDSLDMNYEVSHRLRQIYDYVIKLLDDAMENKEPIFIKDALRVIGPLQQSFIDIEKDGYGNLNKNNLNTDVFAGLTYGKNGLNEFIDESTGGRSFSG